MSHKDVECGSCDILNMMYMDMYAWLVQKVREQSIRANKAERRAAELEAQLSKHS